MSRYRGPRLKKIRRLGALPGLTRKTPKSGSNLKKNSILVKWSNIVFVFKKNRNCVFITVYPTVAKQFWDTKRTSPKHSCSFGIE